MMTSLDVYKRQVVYFMAKIGLSWDDAALVSAHGRSANLVSYVKYHKKTFAILGEKDAVAQLAGKLTQYGMGDVVLYVGAVSYTHLDVYKRQTQMCRLRRSEK